MSADRVDEVTEARAVAEAQARDLRPVPSPTASVSRLRSLAVLLITAVVVFAVDHLTKVLVTRNLALGDQAPSSGPVTIHHVHNTGAAFSLFPQAQALFLAVAVAVSLYIVLAGHRFGGGAFTQVTLGLILGGAVANAVDRAVQGYVVDFVDVHRWPVFNVADTCIVVGILVAVVTFGRSSPGPHRPSDRA